MADGVLGLGAGAASLNNELIEKLKTAERASTVAPIESYIEDIEGEGGESEKITEIIAKVNELLETIKPFDLFVSGGQTSFDSKTANVTGNSVIFDAVDETSINEGTTKVHISQLAQKDVFQTNSFSDATSIIPDGSSISIGTETFTTEGEQFDVLSSYLNEGVFTSTFNETSELLTLDDPSSAVYQSDVDGLLLADFVDVNGGSISINGTGFTITATTTYQNLIDDINLQSDLVAGISTSGRLSISNKDGQTALTIIDSLNTNNIGLSEGEKYSTNSLTYSQLSSDINTNRTYLSSIQDPVSTPTLSSIPTDPSSGKMLTLSQEGRPVYQSDISVASDDLVDASGGSIIIDGNSFTVGATTTYAQLIEEINLNEDLNAKITSLGKLSITNSDKQSELIISDTLATTELGLSQGEKYSAENMSYEDLAKNINSNSNYTATVETVGDGINRMVIKSIESGLDNAINITQTGIDLGFGVDANHTVTAQNLNAEVDGIDYDVSSNVLIVDGGLKITAVEVDAEVDGLKEYSSIAVNKDTSTIEPALQLFVTSYNELVSLVDEELYSSESNIDDKATLRTMMSDIKDKLFGSYNTELDLNIFNFGFEIDKSGVLSLDSATFNEFTETDIESLKSLFVGTAASAERGLGTQLKEYIDGLNGFDGLLSTYETNMNSRKESLEEERDNAIETLDNKYSSLSAQFASYNAIINSFETQFSGLQLMIEQSVSSN